MKKELEETLERWKIRVRELVREEVMKALEEPNERVEGVRELGGQRRQELEKEKESGTDKGRMETAKDRDEERPAVGGRGVPRWWCAGGPGGHTPRPSARLGSRCPWTHWASGTSRSEKGGTAR